MLVVSASLGVKNFAELRRYLERNPKVASYSSYGAGTSSHIAGAVLGRKLGLTELLHVPYKDTRAIPDLVAGRNTFHMEAWSSVKALVKAGQLLAIAVSSGQPAKWAPELPTVARAIGADYDIATWHGVFAPAKTPRNVIDFLNDQFKARMDSAEMRQACMDMGFSPYPHMPPDQFAAFVKGDAARWLGYIKEAGKICQNDMIDSFNGVLQGRLHSLLTGEPMSDSLPFFLQSVRAIPPHPLRRKARKAHPLCSVRSLRFYWYKARKAHKAQTVRKWLCLRLSASTVRGSCGHGCGTPRALTTLHAGTD